MTQEDIITQVLLLDKDMYLPCRDSKHCESVRVGVYQAKTRIIKKGIFKNEAGTLTAQKVEKDGKLFVRIFKRKEPVAFAEEEGSLVPIQDIDEELKRIVQAMLKDGVSGDEIVTFVKEWKGE